MERPAVESPIAGDRAHWQRLYRDRSPEEVSWYERTHDFRRRYDLWHDRAMFHFMVEPADRQAYLAALLRALRPGGDVIIAAFGPAGPETCSGLPVARYDEARLAGVLGDAFEPISSRLQTHHTPSGRTQQFLYAHLRR